MGLPRKRGIPKHVMATLLGKVLYTVHDEILGSPIFWQTQTELENSGYG